MAPAVPKKLEYRFAQRRQKSQTFKQDSHIISNIEVKPSNLPKIEIEKVSEANPDIVPDTSKSYRNSNEKCVGVPKNQLKKQKSAGFLYQPESVNRNWMLKRGKQEMVYYDTKQIRLLQRYFLDMSENMDFAPIGKVQELLITLGLVSSMGEAKRVIDLAAGTTIDFQDFLRILKDSQV